jgi:hypothetical protein
VGFGHGVLCSAGYCSLCTILIVILGRTKTGKRKADRKEAREE